MRSSRSPRAGYALVGDGHRRRRDGTPIERSELVFDSDSLTVDRMPGVGNVFGAKTSGAEVSGARSDRSTRQDNAPA